MAGRPKSIQPIQQVRNDLRTINMLVYAHPGEGKTPFWGTGGKRLLLMDSDNGAESAAAIGSQCSVAPVTTYDELRDILEFFQDGSGAKEFDWVVWDGITLFQQRALHGDIMPDAHAENPNQDLDIPSRREYLKNMNRIIKYVIDFVELPVNFGISAHVLIDKDPYDNTTIWMPMVQGKNMPTHVCGYMNVIGFLGKATLDEGGQKKTVQRLLTQRAGKFYARDRFLALGKHLDKPTLPKVEELINQKRQASGARRVPAKKTAKKAVGRRVK